MDKAINRLIATNLFIPAPSVIFKQLNMSKETIIYIFSHAPEIYCDLSGKFYRKEDNRPLKKIYHCGRVAVRNRNKIYGIKRLRSNAVKVKGEVVYNPF